jgi:hypothetical protein
MTLPDKRTERHRDHCGKLKKQESVKSENDEFKVNKSRTSETTP